MRSDAELEGAYRFFQNKRVTLDRLLEPHLVATASRCQSVKQVLVVHDTTEFRFGGETRREGLGDVSRGGQGFFGHVALAIDAESREPLGLVGLLTVRRGRDLPDHVPESHRWRQLFAETEGRIEQVAPIHVMDREADDFELMSQIIEAGSRFVIRSSASRKRHATDEHDVADGLHQLMYSKRVVAEREVQLSPRTRLRGGREKLTHPTRRARLAKLEISAATLEVTPPKRTKRGPLTVNVVRVIERGQPSDEVPVEWVLLTNERVATTEDVLHVVDVYRARWTIEEYFKVLKTGCAIERRQLESVDALEAILGFFAPIAARLLALRSRAQSTPRAPASSLLERHELRALRILARSPLPRYPTVSDALMAIAALGGHLRRNGAPGWQTLSRGFEDLQIAAQVAAALSDDTSRSDQ
jgi:hypothetical protein